MFDHDDDNYRTHRVPDAAAVHTKRTRVEADKLARKERSKGKLARVTKMRNRWTVVVMPTRKNRTYHNQ